jgi:restriction system protein
VPYGVVGGEFTPKSTSPPPAGVSAYRLHAWLDAEFEQEEIANGFVAIGGSEIGDLTGLDDPEAVRAILTESMPDRTQRAIAIFVGYWRRFRWEAAPGDLVVLPTRDHNVAIGEIVGPYHYVSDAEPRARHRRAVSWNAEVVPKDAFGPDLLKTLNGQHTVQDFKVTDAIDRLRALVETGTDPGPS